ncbi:metallophosphoesterase family protein [Marinobacter sp.]|uniref:metallophosphoesterase family protein n=1 Tax=Marinobacter sp. TaxID=50741 RepID=UPI003BABA2E7
MGSLRLTLRFRDVVAGVDTITEHKNVIGQYGKVLWGWWKKGWEAPFDVALNSLDEEHLKQVTLVDREKKKAYLAECSGSQKEIDRSLFDLVPSYYRGQVRKVSGWFFVNEINEIEYDATLARLLGESTYLVTDGHERIEDDISYSASPTEGRDIVLHISDLHFGKDYAFLPPNENKKIDDQRYTFTNCLTKDLNRLGYKDRVGLVIVTGDFTTQGDWCRATRKMILDEMANLLAALKLSKKHLVAAPGNHDIVRYKDDSSVDVHELAVEHQSDMEHEREYRVFHQELTGRLMDEPLNYWVSHNIGGIDVDVAMLNSCAITATEWTEYGFVSPGGIDVLHEVKARVPVRGCSLKIVALHHHLVPVAKVDSPQGNGVSLTLNSVELLDNAIECGFQIALHGHQHLARIATYGHVPLVGEHGGGPITIVSGGSSGARHERRPGEERNTYSLLVIEDQRLSLRMRELRPDNKPGSDLFNSTLPIDLF